MCKHKYCLHVKPTTKLQIGDVAHFFVVKMRFICLNASIIFLQHQNKCFEIKFVKFSRKQLPFSSTHYYDDIHKTLFVSFALEMLFKKYISVVCRKVKRVVTDD